jgi:hypothetical protein
MDYHEIQPDHSNRRIIYGAATDVGFFSGREKWRMQLSDKTKRFAIALFDASKIDKNNVSTYDTENYEWVKLKINNEKSAYVGISSLAKRIDKKKEEIIEILDSDGIRVLEMEIVNFINTHKLTEEDKQLLREKIIENIPLDTIGDTVIATDEGAIVKLSGKQGFEIETDGYLYPEKPEKRSYVSYSLHKEGPWVLLNIESLRKCTFLDSDKIIEAAKEGTNLASLIGDRVYSLSNIHPFSLKRDHRHQRKVFDGYASDIGVFSGMEKKRLELIPGVRKFAVAIIEDGDSAEENIKWVSMHSSEGIQKVGVNSLAARLNMSNEEICALGKADSANNTQALEDEIYKHLNAYKKDEAEIQNITHQMEPLLDKLEIFPDYETFENSVESSIENLNNLEIKNLFTDYLNQLRSIVVTDDFCSDENKVKILKKFQTAIDESFFPEKKEFFWEKVTERQKIWDPDLVVDTDWASESDSFESDSFESDSKEELAVRVGLINDDSYDQINQ